MIVDEEIPKYRKKKQSSVSKSERKSYHKHKYADCLLIDNENRPTKAQYCTICGKISDVQFFETVRVEQGYRMLNSDEVYQKYKDLPKFTVDSVWDKYVSTEVL